MCIVFAVYEYYICIIDLTFVASRQEYFTLLSHSIQVDGTGAEVLHKEPHHHMQAQSGFLTSSPNGVRTCSDTSISKKKSVLGHGSCLYYI